MVFVRLHETATCCASNCLAPLSIGQDVFIDSDIRRVTARERYSLQLSISACTIFFCNSECAEYFWNEEAY